MNLDKLLLDWDNSDDYLNKQVLSKMTVYEKVIGADYNTFVDTGVYENEGNASHSTANTPNNNHTSNDFIVVVYNITGNSFVQTAYSTNSDRTIYYRNNINGTFNEWKMMATQDDIDAILILM